MVQKMNILDKDSSRREAVSQVGSHQPVPLRDSFSFGTLKRIYGILDSLMQEEINLDLSVRHYSLQPGQWQGERVSDDIWPTGSSKSYKKPWSDYQMEVYDTLVYKLKSFRLGIEERMSHLL